jgi:uncharacterized membrane protein YphA (DoxX/SURF4 family)
MKLLVLISRLLVGVTFVFSGFVKLVDPLGSAYKFQEYFGADVLNLEFLIPYALPFSILLIIAEFLLGLMLLVGYLPKFTAWSLMLMMLIFLFLTWYSAYYNKVTDCGCFGDAVKLSTWGTFYKNVVLVVLIAILVLQWKLILPIKNFQVAQWVSFGGFVLCLYITYYVLIHLPIIDFRPYAIGKNIPQGMEYIGDEDPPIHDFFLETVDGEDYTFKTLEEEKVMWVLAYNLDISDEQGFVQVKLISDEAIEKGYKVYFLSSSMEEDFEALKTRFGLNMELLFGDSTTLKTIIRANPGIVTLEKGTVTGKWNWTDIEDIELN